MSGVSGRMKDEGAHPARVLIIPVPSTYLRRPGGTSGVLHDLRLTSHQSAHSLKAAASVEYLNIRLLSRRKTSGLFH